MFNSLNNHNFVCHSSFIMKFPYYVKLACSLISVVLIIFLLEKGRDVFVPLFFGLLIALLLYPINRFLEAKLKLNKSIAALISVLFFVAKKQEASAKG